MNSLIMNVRQSDIRIMIQYKLIKTVRFLIFFLVIGFYGFFPLMAFEIDLSKRNIGSVEKKTINQEGVLEQILTSVAEPVHSIVILNMENEFVPSTVRLKQNRNYRFFVANVNGKDKNVAFIMDAFNQNHGTYFGQVKVFDINPKTSGLFTFNCPETGAQGKVVVIPDDSFEDSSGQH